jgi:iron complex outermembrane recepter protein
LPREEAIQLNRFAVSATSVKGYAATNALSATRIEEALLETPHTINVLTKPLLDDLGDSTESSVAFKYVAGIRPNLPNNDGYFMRGFPVTLYYDGVRLQAKGIRDPAITDRIEVIRGPSSVLYGVGDPGGGVNYITKRPQFARASELRFTAGSYDFRRVEFDHDLAGMPVADTGRLGARLVGSWTDRGSWRLTERQRRTFIAPMATLRLGRSTEFFGYVSYQEQEGRESRLPPYYDTFARRHYNLPWGYFSGDNRTRFADNILVVNLEAVHAISREWKVKVAYFDSASYRDHYLTPLQTFLNPALNGGRRLATGILRRLLDEYAGSSALAYTVGEVRTGPVEHQLVAGYEHRREAVQSRDTRTRWIERFDLDAPNYDKTLEPAPFSGQSTASLTTAHAFFAQERAQFLERRLSLIGGVRIEDYRTRSDPRYNTLNNTVLDRAETAAERVVTSRFSALLKLTPWLSAYASYNESFLGNALRDVVTGALIPSETAEGTEAGMKFELWGGRISGSVGGYTLERSAVRQVNTLTGAIENLGTVRCDGFEAEAFVSLTDSLQLMANFAFNDARTIDASDRALIGRRPSGDVKRSASLLARQTFRQGPLKGAYLGGGWAHGGDQIDRTGTLTEPSYALVDAFAGYRSASGTYDLSLRVTNLFDRRWWRELRTAQQSTQGDPRHVQASLRLRF